LRSTPAGWPRRCSAAPGRRRGRVVADVGGGRVTGAACCFAEGLSATWMVALRNRDWLSDVRVHIADEEMACESRLSGLPADLMLACTADLGWLWTHARPDLWWAALEGQPSDRSRRSPWPGCRVQRSSLRSSPRACTGSSRTRPPGPPHLAERHQHEASIRHPLTPARALRLAVHPTTPWAAGQRIRRRRHERDGSASRQKTTGPDGPRTGRRTSPALPHPNLRPAGSPIAHRSADHQGREHRRPQLHWASSPNRRGMAAFEGGRAGQRALALQKLRAPAPTNSRRH
jgi:hypothetical protein